MSHFLSSRRPLAAPAAVPSPRRRLLSVFLASVLALALTAGGLVAGNVPQAQAQGPVTVRLEPATASGGVGDVFTIKVYVDNVPAYDPNTDIGGVQAWSVYVDFDPAVVQLDAGQSANTYFAGNLYTTGGGTPFNVVNTASNRIFLGQVVGFPSPPPPTPPPPRFFPSGSNLLLATIKWKAVGAGASALDTNTSTIMKDALNGLVYSPLTELDGQLTVTSNPYDVNGDGKVDVLDIILTADNWLSTDPAKLAIYDFNDNGIVDIRDIMLVTANLTG